MISMGIVKHLGSMLKLGLIYVELKEWTVMVKSS